MSQDDILNTGVFKIDVFRQLESLRKEKNNYLKKLAFLSMLLRQWRRVWLFFSVGVMAKGFLDGCGYCDFS